MEPVLMVTPRTILHIEPDALLANLVGRLIRRWRNVSYLGTARSGTAGLEMCRCLRPAVVILELVLPDIDGFKVADDLARSSQAPRLLAFTSHADDVTLFQASHAPLNGIVWKTDANAEAELRQAVTAVSDGQTYVTNGYKKAMSSFTSKSDAFFKLLSTRELQLLPLLGRGLDDGSIGEKLGIALATVHSHRQRIMGKLNLHNSKELIHWAEEKGFVHAGACLAGANLGPAVTSTGNFKPNR
jgi:DNA-binding NarL/FixJ family response regulator